GEVAVPARRRDRLDHGLPLRPLELRQLGHQLLVLRTSELLPLRIRHQWPQPQEPPQQPPPPPPADGVFAAPCTANEENWRATFVAEQSGQAICSSPRTSSS